MNGAWLFIGLIILIFAAWLGTGGPSRPISFEGPYLKPIDNTGETAEAYGGWRNPGSPGVIGDIVGDSGSSGISEAEASPYRGKVVFARGNGGTATTAAAEYLILRSNTSESLNITGWKLVSEKTRASATIPSGVAVYRGGTINSSSAITFESGDEAVITTGRSPVGGSFRENLCTGYLGQTQSFTPTLGNSCPTPLGELSQYDAENYETCYSYARNLNSCQTGSNPPRACKEFVEDYLNYNGCVDAHEDEGGFTRSTWRIFLNSDTELWGNQRDTIRLLDKNGKVVDVLGY